MDSNTYEAKQDSTRKKRKIPARYIVAFSIVLAAMLLRLFVFDMVAVVGDSMNPTLISGDVVFAEKVTLYFELPSRGDIVVVKYPDSTSNYIKRTAAVGGDTVRVSGGSLYVNDEKTDEPYINGAMLSDFSEVTVPEGCIFVMGDNRNYSADSRMESIGFIPHKNIVGIARFFVWPISDFLKGL